MADREQEDVENAFPVAAVAVDHQLRDRLLLHPSLTVVLRCRLTLVTSHQDHHPLVVIPHGRRHRHLLIKKNSADFEQIPTGRAEVLKKKICPIIDRGILKIGDRKVAVVAIVRVQILREL